MGTLANGEVVAPFANAAMRLLREDWKGKYGSKMLAEELFPILQTGIPNPDQNFQNFITINAGDTGSFAQLIDKFGNKLFEITAADGLKPVEPPGYPPPKLKPRIEWAPKTITAGSAIGAGELDAVATDPETGATIAGSYVYTPPSGTVFASAGTATLYVDFTPTDGVKYRRSKGSTVLTITGGGGGGFTFIDKFSVTGSADAYDPDIGAGSSILLDTPVVAGQLLIYAFVAVNCSLLTGPTDNLGNTYTLLESLGSSPKIKVWSCVSVGSGDIDLRITFEPDSDPPFSYGVALLRYSGSHATPIDSHVSGTAWTTPSIPVSNPGSLVIGVFSSQSSGGFTPTAGQNLRCNNVDADPQPSIYVVDKLSVNAATTMGGTPAVGASVVTVGASFKKA